MNQDQTELLKEINKNLEKISIKLEVSKSSYDDRKLIEPFERLEEYHNSEVQNSFNRIHDRLFNLNSILIAIFLGIITFSPNNPILGLISLIFPLGNLFFFIYIEHNQKEIHRKCSRYNSLSKKERTEISYEIIHQSRLSLISIISTIAILIYAIIVCYNN